MTAVIEIIDSKAERARLVSRTDVLDKVKALATLPGHGEATTTQVAEFYEVPEVSVRAVVNDHTGELKANGLRVVRGSELRELKGSLPEATSLKFVSQLQLWDRRAVLNLGMLLRDSEVAKEVRRYLLDAENTVNQTIVNEVGFPDGYGDLAAALAKTLADHIEPRFKVLEDKVQKLESQPGPKAIEQGAKSFPVRLAEELGVPLVKNGHPFVHGVGRGGPWAGYRVSPGFVDPFIDRNRVRTAYRKLKGAK